MHTSPIPDGAPGAPGRRSADRPNRVPWPPLLYAGLFTLAYGLERWAPLPAWREIAALRWLGWGIVAAGLALAIAGIARFRAVGTTFHPTGAADALADNGIYAWSRNPMYVGGLALFAGLGLALRSPWLLLEVPVLLLALTKFAIEPEEAYLTRRFGEPYRAYLRRTRRWL